MSEYQYYEFNSLDKRLTPEQLKELRSISSRAEITPTSFTNTYSYGDFRGDPRKLMESYFDAYVYVSNFGRSEFILRFPSGVLPEAVLNIFNVGEALESWSNDTHTFVAWRLVDEEMSGEWTEGEGWMNRLLSIRDELVSGDYRSLYIGWLTSIVPDRTYAYYTDELEDAEDGSDWFEAIIEPPVPSGLGSPTEGQVALAEFLDVDCDLLAAAALASSALTVEPASESQLSEWVAGLPDADVRAAIVRVLRGEEARNAKCRNWRLSRSGYTELARPPEVETSGETRRTAAQILALQETIARERKKRNEAERKNKRRKQLDAMIPQLEEIWATLYTLAVKRTGSAYDEVCAQIVDMRDAYEQAKRSNEFNSELDRFLSRCTRSKGITRLNWRRRGYQELAD